MELHCSQTLESFSAFQICLRPLWNYTALKPFSVRIRGQGGLRPLWNYTALKRL